MKTFGLARARALARRVQRRSAAEPELNAFRIELDYPVRPDGRYGYGRPPHPQLDALLRAGHERYRSLLESFCAFGDDLEAIPVMASSDASEPFWTNGWFQGVDFIALYGLVAQRAPSTYLEIGSGNSTRVARRAMRDHDLSTRVVSIDPQPRRAIVDLVDEHIAQPLEDTELSRFDTLGPGDILFFDGSHRSFTNSDATVMFNDVVPRLAAGVLVHVHDVFIPWDYPPYWADRWYSEQYLLSSWLLAGDRLEVVLPAMYVCVNPDLHHVLDPIWNRLAWAGIATNGSSFWFQIRETDA